MVSGEISLQYGLTERARQQKQKQNNNAGNVGGWGRGELESIRAQLCSIQVKPVCQSTARPRRETDHQPPNPYR